MDEVLIRKIRCIIEQNLQNPDFGIGELCNIAGISRSQLYRKLNVISGKSTSLFIRSVRLNKAKELLKKNVGNVSEIAERTGFRSLSYFSQVFTEEFGYPPSMTISRDNKIVRSNLLMNKSQHVIKPHWLLWHLASLIIICIVLISIISNFQIIRFSQFLEG